MKKMKNGPWKAVITFLLLVLGNALNAAAIACFALPYGMVVSGVSGIAKFFQYFFGANLNMVVYAVNILIFLVGLFIMGKRFAATIIVGTFAFPICLQFFNHLTMLHHLVDDPLIAAICAGLLDGLGLGIIIRAGGSTGGIDVPPIILHSKFGLPVAPVMYAIDFTIFIIQIPFTKSNGVILGIIYALIYSVVMNKILVFDQGGVQMLIFSKANQEINERLMQMGLGSTFLHSKTGYLGEEQDTLVCVTSARNINAVKNAVFQFDEKAFLTISSVSEVNGNGYTLWLDDDMYQPDQGERRAGRLVKKK